jgi:hypothetical protein
MADRIQFDGKTYAPIAEAAALAGIDEAKVRLLGAQGKVFQGSWQEDLCGRRGLAYLAGGNSRPSLSRREGK